MNTRHEEVARRRLDDGGAESESDSAVGSGEVEPSRADGFRVRVSLERFFSDERSRVVMWAERGRPAGWLLRRLRAALPLPAGGAGAALALLVDGCLLPCTEPLAVLRPDDLLEVIINPGEDPGAGEVAPPVAAAVEEREATRDELAAVKRRALRLLAEVAGGDCAPAPRRRRRARRRRVDTDTSAQQGSAEHAGAGDVVRSETTPRVARLVSADDGHKPYVSSTNY